MPAQTVYITKSGEKYHKSACHQLKYSKKEITLQVALERKFTACSVCKPTASNLNLKPAETIQPLITEPETSSPKTIATQCTGKTKAGARCKRMTKSANGRCHQH